MLRRSTDGGKTWRPIQVVHEEGGDAPVTIGNPCPVVDRDTGVVWLAFCRDNKRVLVTRSADDGVTWDSPVDVSDAVVRPDWAWVATGPGHGIQLRNGRLLVPCDCKVRTTAASGPIITRHSFALYSDDHGRTWKAGAPTGDGMNECQAVERADGSVLLSMRNYLGKGLRAFAASGDGGVTWSEPELHDQVPCPVCEASVLRYSLATPAGGKDRLLYSGPAEAEAAQADRPAERRRGEDAGRWPGCCTRGTPRTRTWWRCPAGTSAACTSGTGTRPSPLRGSTWHGWPAARTASPPRAHRPRIGGRSRGLDASPGPEYADAGRRFQGIPAVERAKDGRLWAAWYGGGDGEDRHNYVMLATSDDDGKTWSRPRAVIDPDGDGPWRAFDPCLWHDPTGRLWLFFAQRDTVRNAHTWAFTTEDSGDDVPRMVRPAVRRPRHHDEQAARDRGRHVAAAVGPLGRGRERRGRGLGRRRQDVRPPRRGDHPRPGPPQLRRAHAGRAGGRPPADVGADQVRHRREPLGRRREDLDAGREGRGRARDVPVLPPPSRVRVLLLVRHGPLDMRAGRRKLTAFVSDDDGRTWAGGLMLDDRNSVSYPDGVEAADGRVFVVYDRERKGAKEVLLAVFTEADVRAGKPVTDRVRLRQVVNRAGGDRPVE